MYTIDLDTKNFRKWPISLQQSIKSVIGKPYKFNCFDLTGFDCYTLVWYLYSLVSLELPKENISSYNLKTHMKLIKKHSILFNTVSFNNRLPFDILLFESADNINAHLGMVLDTKHFIHVDKEITVKIEPFLENINSTLIRQVYRWKY